jgi:hypothetical protein
MRISFSFLTSRTLIFSMVAEMTFVALFAANYAQLIVSSITSLNSVPIFAIVVDRIESGGGGFSQVIGAISPLFTNALDASLIWSVMNGITLAAYAIFQYRK